MVKMPDLTYMVNIPSGKHRMAELIVYIADLCQEDPTFGATKLNKILFYADFASYAKYGRPITGQEYQRLEHIRFRRNILH